jgi:hypothetical protein
MLGGSTSVLFNVHRVSDAGQVEILTAGQLVQDSSLFVVGTVMKKYKTPGSDEVSTKLIQAEGEILPRSTKSILFGIRKNCLIRGRCLIL